MKYYYFVLTTKEQNGKLWARCERISTSQNILCLSKHEDILNLNICNSRKEAETIAKSWNQTYKENGTCAF